MCNKIVKTGANMFFSFIIKLLSKIFFFTGRISGTKTFLKPLKPEEEKACFIKFKNGDKQAEEKLIKHNMRLVAHVVRKYTPPASFGKDDLISVGTIGLIKAIRNYSLDAGNTFSTFAARCIENEILMLLRSQKKHNGEINLEQSVGRDKDGEELRLMDVLPASGNDVEESISNSLFYEKIKAVIHKCLTQTEIYIIESRYGLNGKERQTQEKIATELGISRSYVSRIENDAIVKLRNNIKGVLS
mgnify:CR=1 FL=1